MRVLNLLLRTLYRNIAAWLVISYQLRASYLPCPVYVLLLYVAAG
jgi:hypothetical protein